MKRTSAACLCHLNPNESRCVTSIVAPQFSVHPTVSWEKSLCCDANTHTHAHTAESLTLWRWHACFRTRCLMPLNYPGCSFFRVIFSSICSPSERHCTKQFFCLSLYQFFPLFFSHLDPVTHTGSHRHPLWLARAFLGCFSAEQATCSCLGGSIGGSELNSLNQAALQLESNNNSFFILVCFF